MSAPTLVRRQAPGRPSGSAPPPQADPTPPRPVSGATRAHDTLLTVALGLLIAAALLPLRKVFIGPEWIRPVVGAALLALGIGWGSRRLGVGPVVHLVMSLIGLVVFVTIAFLPDTAAGGVLPTADTLGAIRDLFLRGLELVRLRPSPTFAEAGLLLLAVAGVWVMTYLADGMLFVLRSATMAITVALVLWCVPLAVAPPDPSILVPAAAMIGAAGVLLLLDNTLAASTWGARVHRPGEDADVSIPLPGWLLLAAAIVAGVTLAGLLPGFQDRPVYELRGSTGTTITTNPIVNIKDRLVATDNGPVVRVSSPRPVYLRTTSLDTFNDREEWGISGNISGSPVAGGAADPPAVPAERVEVSVQIEGIEEGAILAPTPYETVEVAGSRAADMRYDDSSGTLTVPGESPLQRGDTYRVTAALAQPDITALRAIAPPGGSEDTALPPIDLAPVSALAQDIVTAAGATTMFDQALAIQDHLRTWRYTTSPEFGDGATNLEQFINAQEGYCEQFAGTMAVMLRTLGIPARLAVGYTPGTEVADQLWEVTNANAHAWVEVDFGELGWIAFEPTPRTDGNVLVPSAGSVVPDQTVAEGGTPVGQGTFEPVGPGEIPQAQQPVDPAAAPTGLGSEAATGGGGAGGGGGIPGWLVLGLLALLGVGGVVLLRRPGEGATLPPEEVIARARRSVERAGAVVGRPRGAHETDQEYFTRIAGHHTAGRALAGPATREAYAPAVSPEDARTARAAAVTLRERLTGSASAWAKLRLALGDLLDR